MPELVNCTAVVAAANLNPTVFTQLWLTKFDILKAENFENPGTLFSPLAVNATGEGFTFLVVPERIQIGFLSSDVATRSGQKILRRSIGKIVKKLPHTPFGAVGFNFDWLLIPVNPEEIATIERKLFLSQTNPLAKEFRSQNEHFGCYLSKDVGWARLKLDVKPVTLKKAGQALQMTANYHLDLEGENKEERICSFLENWNEACESSEQLSNLLGKGWSQ